MNIMGIFLFFTSSILITAAFVPFNGAQFQQILLLRPILKASFFMASIVCLVASIASFYEHGLYTPGSISTNNQQDVLENASDAERQTAKRYWDSIIEYVTRMDNYMTTIRGYMNEGDFVGAQKIALVAKDAALDGDIYIKDNCPNGWASVKNCILDASAAHFDNFSKTTEIIDKVSQGGSVSASEQIAFERNYTVINTSFYSSLNQAKILYKKMGGNPIEIENVKY